MTRKQKFLDWLATQEKVTLARAKMDEIVRYEQTQTQVAMAVLRAGGMTNSEATYEAKKLVSVYDARK